MNYAVLVVSGRSTSNYPSVVTDIYDNRLNIKSICKGNAIYDTRDAAERTAEEYRKFAASTCSEAEYEVVPANVVGAVEEVTPERVVPAVTRFVIRKAFERN